MQPRDAILPFFEPIGMSSELSSAIKQVLDARLKDGRVTCVLLGEATHGSHEFFVLRHQISRYLIEQHGFQTIALEASWFRTRRLNQFLRNQRLFSADLPGELYYWIWHTAEMADFLIWLKQYRMQTSRPISIHGMDFMYSRGVIPAVLRTLYEQHFSIPQRLTDYLIEFHKQGEFSAQPVPSNAIYNTSIDDLTQLERLIRSRQRETGNDLAGLVQGVRIIRQMLLYATSPARSIRAYLQRDAFMADNVYQLQKQSSETKKILVWAHNVHVATIRQQGQPLSMGAHLADRMPQRCLSLGMLFQSGYFQAIQPGQASHERRVYHVADPLPGSYEAFFDALNMPDGLLDLDSVPANSQAATWWQEPRPYRSIGAAYDPATPQSSSMNASLTKSFSSIIYLNHVQASNLTLQTG